MSGKYVPICGMKVPVRTASEEENPSLKGAYACYNLDTGIIWVNKTIPADSGQFWLTHEALHALLNSSGALRATAATLGIDLDKKKDEALLNTWEEAFIRVITPHIIETFGPAKVRNG